MSERPGFPGYVFGLDEDDVSGPASEVLPLVDLPETDASGKARFTAALSELPESTRPLQAQIVVRMAEAGGSSLVCVLALARQYARSQRLELA